MTDINSQQDHIEVELDAAGALLALFEATTTDEPTEDVLDADGTLMRLDRDEGELAGHTGDTTEEEVSDFEMDDAERAEFMADFRARWRSESLWK